MLLTAASALFVSAAVPSVSVDLSGPSMTGKTKGRVTVVNNGDYPLTGAALSAEISYASGEMTAVDVPLASVIAPGAEAGAEFTASKGAAGKTVVIITVAAVAAVAAAAVCFVMIRRRRRSAAANIAVLLLAAALLAAGPAPASAADAGTSDGEGGISFELVGAEILNDISGRREEIRFVAVLKDTRVKECRTVADFGDCSVKLTLRYCTLDAEVVDRGFRILPSSAVKKDDDLIKGPAAGLYGAEAKEVEYVSPVWLTSVDAASVPGLVFCGAYNETVSVASYKLPFSAAAYVTFNENGESRTLTSGVAQATVYEVAEQAIAAREGEPVAAALKAQVIDKYAERRSAAVFAEDGEIEELRSAIVAKMDEMAEVGWTAGGNVDTKGKTSYSTPAYKKGVRYYGMIYNDNRGSLEAFRSVLTPDGLLSNDYIADIDYFWKTTPGVSCSTSIIGAYTYFVSNIDKVIGAAMMMPGKGNGFGKVGSYTVPSGAVTSDDVLNANTKATMNLAYAELKKGDVLLALWKNSSGTVLSHSIMVHDDPVIIRNSDGSISGGTSRVQTIEQSSSLRDYKDGQTSWKRKSVSFDALYSGSDALRFIPVRFERLESGINQPCYCVLREPNPGRIVRDGLKGTIESSYVIKNVTVTVTDSQGRTAYRSVYSSEYNKTLILGVLRTVNSQLRALESGTYRVTLSVNCRNEEHVLLDVTETK